MHLLKIMYLLNLTISRHLPLIKCSFSHNNNIIDFKKRILSDFAIRAHVEQLNRSYAE